MIEALIRALITIAVLVLCVVLILWFIEVMGVPLPGRAVQILYVILALICILVLVQLLRPHVTWLP